ncbi:ROK family transcriptional regulator [Phytoactinopolyspora limicola]|uniref:ROK family transcriptional regulator n=1 Tax=Phytoactinopolyspora limicola TaxID=2715536 RepID=UPI00140858FC|nr:ROK family transcriptional regulator [Phytoactinopolyspora limicola]
MDSSKRPPGPRSAAVAPSLLREMNQRLLLDRLFVHGPATRPELARDCGLSQPTVFAALADMEKSGLVRPCGRSEVPQGRPAMQYEANPTIGTVVGVDIGHDWLRLLATDLAGNQLSRLDVRNTARSARALVERVSQAVADVTAEAGQQPSAVTHTVIGSPGVYDPQHRRVMYAANLPGWQRAGLADALTEKLGTNLTIDNDANLAALGELTYGAARGVQQFVYLTIGTGLGLGLVLDGQLYRGFTGAAGEVGYLPIGDEPTTAPAENPQRGKLEEALAADAVVRRAVSAGMTSPITAEQVFTAARQGDPRALDAVRAEATKLAQLVAGILAFLDPELIVVGGGVGQNLDLLEPEMTAALAQLTPLRPTMTTGDLGREAVVRGAIAIGVERARETVFNARRNGHQASATKATKRTSS